MSSETMPASWPPHSQVETMILLAERSMPALLAAQLLLLGDRVMLAGGVERAA